MDALDKKVFSKELNNGTPILEAKRLIPALAKTKFEQDYLEPLQKVSHPPQEIVKLRGKVLIWFRGTGNLLSHSRLRYAQAECRLRRPPHQDCRGSQWSSSEVATFVGAAEQRGILYRKSDHWVSHLASRHYWHRHWKYECQRQIIPHAQSGETFHLPQDRYSSLRLVALERGTFFQEQQKELLRDVMTCFPHSLVCISCNNAIHWQ